MPAIWRINTKNQVIAANSKWQKFYGVGPESFPYKIPSIEETIHPDDIDHFETFIESYKNGSDFIYSARQYRSDGKVRLRHTTGTPILKNGLYVGMTGTTFDITDDLDRDVIHDPSLINIRVGQNVSKIRRYRGITQKDLALSLGITQSAISQIETGRTNMSLDILYKLMLILNVPIKCFFEEV